MFKHVNDAVPAILQPELLRLARLEREWIAIKYLTNEPLLLPSGVKSKRYSAATKHETWLRKTWSSASDIFAMWAQSIWLLDGPKVFRPTPQQCQALEQIELRILFQDYTQPYPALLIDLPPGYEPFKSVTVTRHSEILIAVLVSEGNLNDITSTICTDDQEMELSLQRYDEDCQDIARACGRALRVALNSCLVLTDRQLALDYLYPKDVASDQRLAKEPTERGEKARKRLSLAPRLVTPTHEVVLHKTSSHEPGEASGKEVSCHWRRGHWAMQPYGPGHSLRKRILRPPVLVREDLMVGDLSSRTTIYRT